MQAATAALLLLASTATADKYPVYSPGGEVGTKDTCEGISCKALECKPPFKYMPPDEMGTCCPLCWSETVTATEDRAWTKGLTGGVDMNNNADPVLCRTAVCLPLWCPEYDQIFDGRCCTKCKTAGAVMPADRAKAYK